MLQQDAELKALKTKMAAIEEIIQQAAEASQGGKRAVEQVSRIMQSYCNSSHLICTRCSASVSAFSTKVIPAAWCRVMMRCICHHSINGVQSLYLSDLRENDAPKALFDPFQQNFLASSRHFPSVHSMCSQTNTMLSFLTYTGNLAIQVN